MNAPARTLPRSLAPIVANLEFDRPAGPLSLDDLARVADVPRERARLVASRLAERGWLVRVRHGLYEFVPAAAGYPSASEWLAFADVRDDVFVSGLTAAGHHGLTPQLSSRHIVVVPASRAVPQWLNRAPFHVARLIPRRVFGAQIVHLDGNPVPVATVERVLIDALASPRWFAGAGEAARIIRAGFPQADLRILLGYARRYRSRVVSRRIGWWGERILGPQVWSADDRMELLGPHRPSERIGGLVAGHGEVGPVEPRWGLAVNVSDEVLASEEAVR